MKKCKHKWVDMEDGSLDKFCVRCRKFSMQAVMKMPLSSTVAMPVAEDVSIGNQPNTEIKIGPPNISELSKQIDREMKRSMRLNGF